MVDLKRFIAAGRSLELVEEGIYSTLDNASRRHQYDRKAGFYDLVVGSRLYNRLLWGASPVNYAAFARAAVNTHPNGVLLDAGCGSMLFTAEAHIGSGRTVIACDQSLDMLRRARARLRKLDCAPGGNVLLVQADITDLPFNRDVFDGILCMNVLHHCADATALIRALGNLLTVDGRLHLTTLALNDRPVGDRYLNLLHEKKWIARPRHAAELSAVIGSALHRSPDIQAEASIRAEGNMLYISVPNAAVRDIENKDESGEHSVKPLI